MDTEAGRLLAKLYKGKTKPTIKYPKVKTSAKFDPSGKAFVPGGGKVGKFVELLL
jgi:hypothetical protein